MQKELKCPHCGGNRYQQINNGVCKCSYCGGTFTIPELQVKLNLEPRLVKKEIEIHYLTINWKGIFALYDAPIDLNVNGIRYNHAFLGSGFSIKVPLESVMNIGLSCVQMSSSIRLSLDPNVDYEMDLKYSLMKNWFSSFSVYKKGKGKDYIERGGDIENENPNGKLMRGCAITGLVICILFFIFILYVYNSVF